MTPSQELTILLEEKDKIIGTTYGAPSYHAIQNIIRCIDYILPFYFKSNELELKQIDYFRELIGFGWPRLLNPDSADLQSVPAKRRRNYNCKKL